MVLIFGFPIFIACGKVYQADYLYVLPKDPNEKILKIQNEFIKWEKKSYDIAKVIGGTKNKEKVKKDLIAEAILIFEKYNQKQRKEILEEISEEVDLTINDLLKDSEIELSPYKKSIKTYYREKMK